MNDSIKEKLKQVNLNEVEFTITYKGKKLHSATVPIPNYAEEVLSSNEAVFDLFFYDMTRKLKEKIDKEHQSKFFEKQDGTGVLREKDKEQQ